jgi:glycosyltransferase involved in cell wall biosynthesis
MLTVALTSDPRAQPMAGIPRYMRSLRRELERRPDLVAVRPFNARGWLAPADGRPEPMPTEHAGGQGGGLGHRLTRQLKASLVRQPLAVGAYVAWKTPGMRALLDASGADVYHEPNFTPWPTRLPTVVTIHDLSVFAYPQFHPADRVAQLTRDIPRTVARAQHIITLSETMKREMVAMLGISPDRISAVPIGIDPVFHLRSPVETAPGLARLGLDHGRYLLFVGTLEPRKNLIGLLEALDLLPDALIRSCPLVVIGGKGWHDGPVLARLSHACRQGKAIQLGAVSDDDLACTYASARGVVFPSFYEGQGLPALEAAVSGVPVLTTSGSPMQELLGEHGLYAAIGEGAALAEHIRRLIGDDSLGTCARAAASSLAAAFHWDTCVERTLAAYQRAVAA